MKINGKKPDKGLVLPAIMSVLVVLTFLTLAITSQGTSSLRQVSHNTQSDQAFYAADAGLARALAEYENTGEIKKQSSGKVESTGATFSIALHANDTPTPKTVSGGSTIPPNSALLVATGKSSSTHINRRSAVLVQKGLGTVQVGSLARHITADDSKFQAFDSKNEDPGYTGEGVDPNSLLTQEAIIATNEGSGTPVTLNNSEVIGNILVGPGGNTGQVKVNGSSTVGQVGTLTDKIDLPPIEVPSLPGNDDTGAPPEPAYWKPSAHPEHISFSQDSSGNLSIKNQCFNCKVDADGTFTVSEAGGKFASGNIKTGQVYKEEGFDVTITGDTFQVDGGTFHGLILDYDAQMIWVDPPTNDQNGLWKSGNKESFPMPQWLSDSVFRNPPPDLHNPDEIPTGYYDEVLIDAGISKLLDSSTLVINNLTIDGGQLNLPNNGKDVTIYVTGSLTIKGDNAILNDTRKA